MRDWEGFGKVISTLHQPVMYKVKTLLWNFGYKEYGAGRDLSCSVFFQLTKVFQWSMLKAQQLRKKGEHLCIRKIN